MGYFVIGDLGDITAMSKNWLPNSISYNDDVMFSTIFQSPKDWKWLNETFVYIPQPTLYHRWTGETWAYDTTLVLNAQEDMWERIKTYRDQRECGGVKLNVGGTDYWFHSDTRSLIKYLFLLFLATVFSSFYVQPIIWKTMSDAETPLTTDTIVRIFFTVMTTGDELYKLGRQHKQNMLNSDDPLHYNYRTGSPPWPPIYGE